MFFEHSFSLRTPFFSASLQALLVFFPRVSLFQAALLPALNILPSPAAFPSLSLPPEVRLDEVFF